MSNHIGHIEITNFKSIRHMKIEGCKRINVFIGYPNVGKSNILEAISTLSFFQKDFELPFSKLCRFKSPSELYFDGYLKNNISVKFSNEFNLVVKYLSEKEIQISILKSDDAQSILFPYDQNWTIYRELTFSEAQIYNRKNNILEDVLVVKKYSFQNEYFDFKTNGLTLSFPEGKNLVDIVQFNKELRKEVIDLFKASGLKLNIDQSNNSIKGFKQLDDELVFTIPFYQMADTLQRLIFHKAAIMSNENAVLLFEEPEAHMFPPYISKFTADVMYDERKNQYFISTHSPFVLNDFMENLDRNDLSIYAVGLDRGETTIKLITDDELNKIYQYGIDLFFNLEDYLKNV